MKLPYFIIVLCLVSGCKSDPRLTNSQTSLHLVPRLTGDVTPTNLVNQITSADHILVTNPSAGHRGAPSYTSFSKTITGPEAREIIWAISSLRAPIYDPPQPDSLCGYEWRLQFYRGREFLGSADLGECLVRCDGVEYVSPSTLNRLYNRISDESGEREYRLRSLSARRPLRAV